VIFLTGVKDDMLFRSSRNIPTLSMVAAENAHTYQIMNSDVVLFTRTAVDRVKEVLL
jgi:large subunit ribosomal protein L4